jgi:17beta-estradiol 17-dehydrogenase / very-long-chain 3-oxoacyl-CoA reductase
MTLINSVFNALTTGAPDEVSQTIVKIVGFLGVLRLLSLLWAALSGLRFYFRSADPRQFGEWAVVTGATDGIGFAYAKELARRGMNVMLISRTQSKLDDKQAQLERAFPNVQVRTYAADFSRTDIYDDLAEALEDLPVGLLVNNVGMSYPHAEHFHLITDELIDSLINLNVHSTTWMTRIVMSGMVERKKGAVVNISSAAGVLSTGDPLYAVYSATKGYIDMFSRSLELEYASAGIKVQCQVPYFVTSKLSKIRNTNLVTPDPDGWARAAVPQIGYGNSVVPYPMHALQHYILQNAPQFIVRYLILSHHKGIRARALKKKAKEGKAQ